MSTLAQLVNQIARRFASLGDARLRPLGFRYAQVPVLALLRSGDKLTQADLVRRTGVEQSSMSQLLMRLEREGAITRQPHADHARMSIFSVTREAAKGLPAAGKVLMKLDKEALAGLDDKDVATLFGLLERVLKNLESLK